MTFRNEEKKELRHLTPEQRSEIVEAWIVDKAEHLTNKGWEDLPSLFALLPDDIYRVAIKTTKVFWEEAKIPDKYVAYARNSDAEEFLYTIEPKGWDGTFWPANENDFECMRVPSDLAHLIRELGDEAPEDSLILRGE